MAHLNYTEKGTYGKSYTELGLNVPGIPWPDVSEAA